MIDAGTLAAWLEIACLAPSPHNNQPWTARLRPDGVLVRLDPRLLPPLGPDRVQFMALGAFIENMSYAAAAAGYQLTVGELPTVPRRGTEITVRFRAGAEPGGGARTAGRTSPSSRRGSSRSCGPCRASRPRA